MEAEVTGVKTVFSGDDDDDLASGDDDDSASGDEDDPDAYTPLASGVTRKPVC